MRQRKIFALHHIVFPIRSLRWPCLNRWGNDTCFIQITSSQVSNFHSQGMRCCGKKKIQAEVLLWKYCLILSVYYVFFLFSVFVPAVVPPLTRYLSSRWYIIFPQPHSGELRFLQGRELLSFYYFCFLIYWYCSLIFTFTRLNVQNMVRSKLVELW